MRAPISPDRGARVLRRGLGCGQTAGDRQAAERPGLLLELRLLQSGGGSGRSAPIAGRETKHTLDVLGNSSDSVYAKAASHEEDPERLALAFVPPHYLGPLELDRGWPYFMARHSLLETAGSTVLVLGPLGGRQLYRFPRRSSTGWPSIASLLIRATGQPRSTYAERIERQLDRTPVDVVVSCRFDRIGSASERNGGWFSGSTRPSTT